MDIFFGKTAKIGFGVLSALVSVANIFVGNILVYEITTGVSFDWMKLLKSRFFWTVLVISVIYYVAATIYDEKAHNIDEKLEKAISDSSIKFLDIATNTAERGDFESSKKAIKMLDKLQKKRRK